MRTARRAVAFLIALLAFGVWHYVAWAVSNVEVHLAILDTRAVVASQLTYAAGNSGFFEANLSCIRQPSLCGGNDERRSLLTDGDISRIGNLEYRSLIPGQPPPRDEIERKRLSPSSVKTFAYVAAPARRAPWWVRYSLVRLPPVFCGDQRGDVCWLASGSDTLITGLGCPPECRFD